MVGGIIAIIDGSKAKLEPKTARILLILGGIIGLVNILSIIAGILVRESELYLDPKEVRVIETTLSLSTYSEFCVNCIKNLYAEKRIYL